ncbi:hypothetical protein CRENBAI_026658 [Crenichthys baileyi]|uniref:Uncharacterized protein n=1 Tax=Crenichthys baileyi TaxID=28760 RepID=A0AAV9QRH6_9TELE
MAEEQRSPFWGRRLAIPLPGTGPRRNTSSPPSRHKSTVRHTAPSLSSESVLGTAQFLCLVQDSSTPPPQSSCLLSDSKLLVCSSPRRQDTVPPVVEIRTGASISFREGPANTPSSCVASSTSLPGSSLAPAITQRPLVAPDGRTLNMLTHLYSLKLLKTLPPELRAIHTLLHGFCRVQLLFELPYFLFLTSLRYLPTFQIKSPLGPPTTPPASAISEGSADTPASVSAGIQQDAAAFVSAGGQPGVPAPVSTGDQPDISASVSAFPDQPPATAAQLFLLTNFLKFLWGILSEVFGVPVPASAVGRRDTSASADQSTVSSSSSTLLVQTLSSSLPPVSTEGWPVAPVQVPEFREGFKNEPRPHQVPEFREGFKNKPPASRVLELREGFMDEPPPSRVLEFQEGFKEEPPLAKPPEPQQPQPTAKTDLRLDFDPESKSPDSQPDSKSPDSQPDSKSPDSQPDSKPPGFHRGRLPDLVPGGFSTLRGRPPDLPSRGPLLGAAGLQIASSFDAGLLTGSSFVAGLRTTCSFVNASGSPRMSWVLLGRGIMVFPSWTGYPCDPVLNKQNRKAAWMKWR